MSYNNIFTVQQEEESSSLKNQGLLFIRRPDLTADVRLHLAIAGLEPSMRNSTIAKLCEDYKVSHEFIYSLSRKLKSNKDLIFGSKGRDKVCELAKKIENMRFLIEGRVYTQGPLHGLSSLSQNWGFVYNSTNFISQSIDVAGTLVGNTLNLADKKTFTILCDEVFSGGQAILVILEAQSMAVLDIKILDKPLTSADWEARFALLEQNNISIGEIVKDQGVAMAKATSKLSNVTLVADTFHAVAKRLGIYIPKMERSIKASMGDEEKANQALANAASEGMKAKQQAKLETARLKTAELLDQLDWFKQAYFLLLRQLRPFTSNGLPRDREMALANIQFALDILELLPLLGLGDHIKHIRKLAQSGELLNFMTKVPALYEKWEKKLPTDTLWLWMIYWLEWKKAFQTHSSKVQKQAKQRMNIARELLSEYYESKDQLDLFEQTKVELFASLDTIVQASSLVETFNSILKPFINGSRGQMSQEFLNLVMFYHNHRVFNERSKRGGKSPIELLTGKKLDKSWIDLLMDIISNAFLEHDTTSLKELHAQICKKNKEQDPLSEVVYMRYLEKQETILAQAS